MTDDGRHDDTTEEYRQGEAAFLAGRKADANPYPEDTDRYAEWLRGWLDAEQIQNWM